MKELILICIVAFVFVFGYLIMRKVDMFLAENNLQTKEHSPSSSLRIGFEAYDIASLRVFMATLRKKLEKDADSPQYIQTHIGVGYRMMKVEWYIAMDMKNNIEEHTEWIYCPACGNKTRLQIWEDTELKNFPLYCPKCKRETLIEVKELQITVIKEPDT